MDEFQALERLRQTPRRDLLMVSKITRIPWPTLIKVKYGITEFPRLPTLKKLVIWAEQEAETK